ncbi:MAG: fluoride efflux transporter CrcB [Gammaproteobacteria bacterium]|nr:fluoride efflux transporter CrcB [Gammaproteobacteria bacterium]
MTYVWIAIGSALGGVGRYAMSGLSARYFGENFPWGTFAVNVSGSLAIGVLAALLPAEARPGADQARAFLMIGICGGFTTFSSFSLETLNLARNGDWPAAAGYTLGSVVLCLAAVCLGYFGTLALSR